MSRKVIFSKEKLKSGVEKLALAVGSTLGPKGRNVLIETDNGAPFITKDGVTVARFVTLTDPLERLSSTIVSQSAQATVRAAGDGTTTSIVLAHDLIQKAWEHKNMPDVIKGIEAASLDTVKKLEERTQKMDPDYINHVAYISANNDHKLADVITEAFVSSGEDGVVEVQLDANSQDVSLDIKPGSFFPQGFTNQAYINNMRGRTCDLEDCFVLVCSATIDDHVKILHLLEYARDEGKHLIIIADTDKNFDEFFLSNVQKQNISGCIIKPGPATTDMLKDLADLLGAKYFDNSFGNNLELITPDFLGKADKAVIGDTFTLFTMEEAGDVTENVEILKDLIENEENELVKKRYKQRLSMLNGKYATIKVGAPTEIERGEIKDRIDDAVFAVGAAQKFGYLPGGGVALRDISSSLAESLDSEQSVAFLDGYVAFLGALLAPFLKILSNAGITPKADMDEGIGIDASNGNLTNMIASGIIDPSFVTIQAVTNATSSATALLSTNATIIRDEVESDK